MVPENIIWAFFSPYHYRAMEEESVSGNLPVPNDTYYQDVNGKWLKVTAVYDCIEAARCGYKYSDTKYLGGVLRDTKTQVPRGSVFPPPAKPAVELDPRPSNEIRKKKKKIGKSGTVSLGSFDDLEMDKVKKLYDILRTSSGYYAPRYYEDIFND